MHFALVFTVSSQGRRLRSTLPSPGAGEQEENYLMQFSLPFRLLCSRLARTRTIKSVSTTAFSATSTKQICHDERWMVGDAGPLLFSLKLLNE
jgi:hypothetical protein